MDDTISVSGRRGSNAGASETVESYGDAGADSDLTPNKQETVTPEPIGVEQSDMGANSDDAQDQVNLVVKVTKKGAPSQREAAAKGDYTPRYSTPTRRPGDKRHASFNPLAWVADGVTGAIEEVRHNDLGLSQEFWTHLYAVRRESLLTARALVESLIAKVESKGDEQEARQQRRERRGSVDIDF